MLICRLPPVCDSEHTEGPCQQRTLMRAWLSVREQGQGLLSHVLFPVFLYTTVNTLHNKHTTTVCACVYVCALKGHGYICFRDCLCLAPKHLSLTAKQLSTWSSVGKCVFVCLSACVCWHPSASA